ncbi:MAG TPA: hypothetical protein VFR10_13535 [bacterium]|nr:hypothetical protein [bacterium]
MRFFRIAPIAAFLVATHAALPRLAFAGAWTLARGALYDRVSGNGYNSDEEFDLDGNREDLPLEAEFKDVNFVNYLEFGITDRFTAFGSMTVKHLQSENLVRITKTWGIGDADLGLRGRIIQGKQGVFSAQALARIPTGYDENDAIPLGSGEPEYEGRLLYGRSLWPLFPGYCGAEAGYRWRTGTPEDEFRYLAEIGSDLGKGFYFRTKLDGIMGMETGTVLNASGNPTVRESYDLGTLYVTAGHRFGTLSLEAEYAPSLYGTTTSAGSTVSLAVSFALTGLLGVPSPAGAQ